MTHTPLPMVSGRYFLPNAPELCLKLMPACEVTSTNSIGPDGRAGAAFCVTGCVGSCVPGCMPGCIPDCVEGAVAGPGFASFADSADCRDDSEWQPNASEDAMANTSTDVRIFTKSSSLRAVDASCGDLRCYGAARREPLLHEKRGRADKEQGVERRINHMVQPQNHF